MSEEPDALHVERCQFHSWQACVACLAVLVMLTGSSIAAALSNKLYWEKVDFGGSGFVDKDSIYLLYSIDHPFP